jgi:D-glycero-alpha-D-manno-heptose-7-phosphate kinase
MIISRTPVRISFLGGGTDYPEHFMKEAGYTLSATIDKYCYITVQELRDFFDHKVRVSYSRLELAGDAEQIIHPSVRECLRYLGVKKGVEIHCMSDLPARTGLGSSSAFTVGMLNALYAWQGKFASPQQLAEEAVHIERNLIKERVGLQDQYASAFGGFLHITYTKHGEVHLSSVPLRSDRIKALEQRLLLFYTGLQRSASDILEEQLERTKRGELQGPLKEMAALVPRALEVICNGADLSEFGKLLHKGWIIKRGLSAAVSTGIIDTWYERARSASAVGGKLLGAGSGGFLLLYVEPENHDKVRRALADLQEVPFRFENQGSTILFSSQ